MWEWLIGTNGIGGIIVKSLRSLIYWLDEFVYGLIPSIYNLFDKLCTARMLDGEIMRTIADRVGLLLGIIMFFYVIFNLIQSLLNPDLITDKEKGAANIVKKIIVVIVLLGVSNFAFDALYNIQKTVIKSDVISKLILPYTVENKENFGNFIVTKLMGAFYEIKPEEVFTLSDSEDVKKYNECKEIYDLLEFNILNYNDLELGHMCLNEALSASDGKKSIFIVDFDAIISLIVGGAVVYFLFSYCITVGVRMLQLMCLEVISPMAIIGYLSVKKDNIFTKWWKLYFATYIDVFIRIAIISFALFLIATVFNSSASGDFIFWSSMGVDPNSGEAIFLEIILILAILTFAKKAPDLIKELFPAGASKLGFGITSPKQMFDNMLGGNLVKGGLGFASGAIIGGAGNFLRNLRAKDENGNLLDMRTRLKRATGGILGGAWTGAKAGAGAKGVFKAFGASNKAAGEQNMRIAEWYANGGKSPWSRWRTGFEQRFNLQTEAESFELEKRKLEEENTIFKEYSGHYDTLKSRAKSKLEAGEFTLETFAGNEFLYSGAKYIFEQKQRIDMLKASAANANNTTRGADGLTDFERLNREISQEIMDYNQNIDDLCFDYIDSNKNSSTAKDKVIAQEYEAALELQGNNDILRGLNMATAEEFKKSSDIAKSMMADNNIKISTNKSKGKSARADAKYSGKGGGKS